MHSETILEIEQVIDSAEIAAQEVINEVQPKYNPIMRLIIFITKSIEKCINSIFQVGVKPL